MEIIVLFIFEFFIIKVIDFKVLKQNPTENMVETFQSLPNQEISIINRITT